MFDQFRSDLANRDVHIPVLIVHGDDEHVIPINLAKGLFERANQLKAFISVVGVGHLVLESTEVYACVREWIDTRTVGKRRSGTEQGERSVFRAIQRCSEWIAVMALSKSVMALTFSLTFGE